MWDTGTLILAYRVQDLAGQTNMREDKEKNSKIHLVSVEAR
jgi:hypothetical protein